MFPSPAQENLVDWLAPAGDRIGEAARSEFGW
jgi:hypothetical protein